MISRRTFFRSALGAALAVGLAAPAQAAEDRNYLLATASTGGTFYPVGLAIATLVKVKLQPKQKIGLSAINSAGSAENVKLLGSDEAQFAILQGLYGHYAWNGVGPVSAFQTSLRSATMLWQNVEQFLAKAEHNLSGTIADLDGLKGKAMAMGEEARMLEFSDEQAAQADGGMGLWTRYVVPAGTYPGQEQAINTIAQPNFLAVRADVDEDAVYRITKAIYENLPFLNGIHKATKAMALDKAVAGLPMPLHPGTLRYYREAEVTVPERLVLQ